MAEWMPTAGRNAISRLGQLFLIVNLVVFPVASLLLLPVANRILETTPLWVLAAVPVILGLALIGINAGLALAARRAAGWNGETTAMAVWTALCMATFVLMGAYSPLNLALRLVLRAAALA